MTSETPWCSQTKPTPKQSSNTNSYNNNNNYNQINNKNQSQYNYNNNNYDPIPHKKPKQPSVAQQKAKYNASSSSKPSSSSSNGRTVQSLFRDNDLLNINFSIPQNASKSEIEEIRKKVHNLYDADVVALEQFYDEQLALLERRIAQM